MAHYVQRVNQMENEGEATRLELYDLKALLAGALERIEHLEAENARWTAQDFDTALDAVVTEGVESFNLVSGDSTPRNRSGALDQLGRELEAPGQPGLARPQGWDSALGPQMSSSFIFGDQELVQTAARTPWSAAGYSPPGLGPQDSGRDFSSRVPPTVANLRQQVDSALVHQLVPRETRQSTPPQSGSLLGHFQCGAGHHGAPPAPQGLPCAFMPAGYVPPVDLRGPHGSQ